MGARRQISALSKQLSIEFWNKRQIPIVIRQMNKSIADRRIRRRATYNFLTLSLGTGLMALAATSALAADQLHERTSPDAFMHVQYTSKAEFIQGLKDHPKTLSAMAKCFGTSPRRLLQFIRDDVHLGRLQSTRSYAVWGLHKGHVYTTNVRYMAGVPAWVTSDGTPVIYWRCSNPMMNELPMSNRAPMAIAPEPPVVTPPPPPVEVVPPPTPPVEVIVTPPPPVEVVTPPPAVVIVTPPPPVVIVAPPVVVVTPPPAPPMVADHEYRRWFGIKAGALPWTEFFGTNETMATAGVDIDLWSVTSSSHLALYVDTAGEFEKHSPYAWYGGGLEYRQEFADPARSFTPYIGVGLGYYSGHVDDQQTDNFNVWGGKAFVGMQFRCGPFLELQYNQLGNVNNRNLSRFGLSLGYRF